MLLLLRGFLGGMISSTARGETEELAGGLADKWLGVVLSPVFNRLINGPEERDWANEMCRWLRVG